MYDRLVDENMRDVVLRRDTVHLHRCNTRNGLPPINRDAQLIRVVFSKVYIEGNAACGRSKVMAQIISREKKCLIQNYCISISIEGNS